MIETPGAQHIALGDAGRRSEGQGSQAEHEITPAQRSALVLFGCGLSLARAMEVSGLAAWIAIDVFTTLGSLLVPLLLT